jgi:hypothetical protein
MGEYVNVTFFLRTENVNVTATHRHAMQIV